MPRSVETTEEQQHQDSLFYLVRRLPASWFKQADANESDTDSEGHKCKTKKQNPFQMNFLAERHAEQGHRREESHARALRHRHQVAARRGERQRGRPLPHRV